ncbi:hypothetical protein KIN20_011305 [Parelaphostrongylus tenuis]|uniref:Uncharacterized protein n=1 Tax=Parelaphostrongylus tenuis TaxID=148309 RepID=A0AAD5QLZ0_PARTN|nr:hypothetical protein KIN20_011305 [Parelaphostrongylus tenuis]
MTWKPTPSACQQRASMRRLVTDQMTPCTVIYLSKLKAVRIIIQEMKYKKHVNVTNCDLFAEQTNLCGVQMDVVWE